MSIVGPTVYEYHQDVTPFTLLKPTYCRLNYNCVRVKDKGSSGPGEFNALNY